MTDTWQLHLRLFNTLAPLYYFNHSSAGWSQAFIAHSYPCAHSPAPLGASCLCHQTTQHIWESVSLVLLPSYAVWYCIKQDCEIAWTEYSSHDLLLKPWELNESVKLNPDFTNGAGTELNLAEPPGRERPSLYIDGLTFRILHAIKQAQREQDGWC